MTNIESPNKTMETPPQVNFSVPFSVSEHMLSATVPISNTTPEGIDQRRSKRVSVLWSGEYTDSNGRGRQCLIYNISATGILGEFQHPLKIGTKHIIKINKELQPLCEVVWTKGENAGLRFVN